VYKTLSVAGRILLYSKIGKGFLQVIKPDAFVHLLYDVLALLNKGVDGENSVQRQIIADMNLFVVCEILTK
jgi:hypothetical protein